ncbi:MAG: hypothetical protein HOP12_09490 [Candidatus Eisenbacteria bacterium]|uniref:Uncharacterized protein n=1 Tax=Eiseniibacteriota bacterium TaxID=2212470 RepID=A0A849SZ79_UNCEI|nr:hypothetical protein [Candidatus Eisenbacteria bacterium]
MTARFTRSNRLRGAVMPASLVLALAFASCGASDRGPARATPSDAAPVIDEAFWKHWGDGRGELAGYDLTVRRYGELRRGTAVTIFVTETFSDSLRVKADPGRHSKADEFPVMKLNRVEDFPTGIYDYNLMTSVFVSLAPHAGRGAGTVTKVAFSAQEWCGQAFAQLLFDADRARYTSHSYFDGEADEQRSIAVPRDAISGDALMLWARGFAAPRLAPGARVTVPLVGSLATARLTHQPLAVGRVTLTRAAARERITVPAGTFETERFSATIAGGQAYTFDVETVAPRRIVRWTTHDGGHAELLGSERLAYWKSNGLGGERGLAGLGLRSRPWRTP